MINDPINVSDWEHILERVQLGHATEQFLNTQLGRHLVTCLQQYRRDALREVDEIKPGAEITPELYFRLHLPLEMIKLINGILSDMNYGIARAEQEEITHGYQ